MGGVYCLFTFSHFNMTECFNIDQKRACLYVRLSVCVSVCLCLSVPALAPKRLNHFQRNLVGMIGQRFTSAVFLKFLISHFDDVMAAIL